MESRKIQKSASGSFFVTLPKSWVKESGLKHGDRIELVAEKNHLSLFSKNRSDKQSTEVKLNLELYTEPSLLERQIVSCYVRGYDIINIYSKKMITYEWKNLIKKTIINLTGTEISEDFSDRVSIRTLVDPSKFPLKDLLKRICGLVSTKEGYHQVEQFVLQRMARNGDTVAQAIMLKERILDPNRLDD